MNEHLSYTLEKISQISPYFVSGALPEPFIGNNIKAIFLGADPGTVSGQRFTHVFGLEDGENSRYFKQFLPNLEAISLVIDNLFVQNLCRNYFDRDTLSHRKDWTQCATHWVGILKSELDELNPTKDLPVLVSAYIVLEALCKGGCKAPEFYYTNRILVRKNQNHLGRTLIPFFRGGFGKYDLRKTKWILYANKIKKHVGSTSVEHHDA